MSTLLNCWNYCVESCLKCLWNTSDKLFRAHKGLAATTRFVPCHAASARKRRVGGGRASTARGRSSAAGKVLGPHCGRRRPAGLVLNEETAVRIRETDGSRYER